PIVMMYAGNEIDFENISSENFPTATERARLAHLDPSAVTKYFDVMIRCILDTIVGYGKKHGGVFGNVKNYYGVVEYQDRGTPHCHLLVWIYGSLNPIELRQKLRDDETFSQRLLTYISDIVKEDIGYLLKKGEILTDEMLEI
ncbi:12847_t:CDS:1, partial [Ambispora leptoticha]